MKEFLNDQRSELSIDEQKVEPNFISMDESDSAAATFFLAEVVHCKVIAESWHCTEVLPSHGEQMQTQLV